MPPNVRMSLRWVILFAYPVGLLVLVHWASQVRWRIGGPGANGNGWELLLLDGELRVYHFVGGAIHVVADGPFAVGVVTLLLIFVLGGLVPWSINRRYLNWPRLACRVCGYDLRGNVSGVCPECGSAVERRATQPPIDGPVEDRVSVIEDFRAFVDRLSAGADFDGFDDHARQALGVAERQAGDHRMDYVGSEHLLLGLLEVTEGAAARLLGRLSCDEGAVRALMEHLASVYSSAGLPTGSVLATPAVKRAVEDAVEEARATCSAHARTEHLLLGLLRQPDSVASQLLESEGISIAMVREVLAEECPAGAVTR